MSAPSFQSVASAPIFVITAPGAGIAKLSFQELSGINSEINIEQYISVDPLGNVNHTKQMGLTKPPSVTLRKGLDSPVADLANVSSARDGGMLVAGLFLREFVPDGVAWAHLDIAGPYIRDKDWKYYEAGAIGFGLKTLVDLVERFDEYFQEP